MVFADTLLFLFILLGINSWDSKLMFFTILGIFFFCVFWVCPVSFQNSSYMLYNIAIQVTEPMFVLPLMFIFLLQFDYDFYYTFQLTGFLLQSAVGFSIFSVNL